MVRPFETQALYAWAKTQHLLLNNEEFTRTWKEAGAHHGMENDVYFNPTSQRWWKRNSLMASSHYLEFLQRIQLHNWIFPETAMRLEGFTIDESEGATTATALLPVFSQPHVDAARGARPSEARRYLEGLGFEAYAHDQTDPDAEGNVNYHHPEIGIFIEDLHDENVFIHPEPAPPIVVDPIIVFNPATKIDRLRAELAQDT